MGFAGVEIVMFRKDSMVLVSNVIGDKPSMAVVVNGVLNLRLALEISALLSPK